MPLLTFWAEASEYEMSEKHLSDRLIRKSQAWRLFNKYIGEPRLGAYKLLCNLYYVGTLLERYVGP